MQYETKTIPLKNGKQGVFESPNPADAKEMLEYLKICSGETDFILRYPEECVETEEQERAYLAGINESDFGLMIVCKVDGAIAGNCQIAFNRRTKIMHRATISIALLKQYWGLGIGTAMLTELIEAARSRGVSQLELEYIEGNVRAKGLYEKMGFCEVAQRPDAIRLKNGEMQKEIIMIKKL